MIPVASITRVSKTDKDDCIDLVIEATSGTYTLGCEPTAVMYDEARALDAYRRAPADTHEFRSSRIHLRHGRRNANMGALVFAALGIVAVVVAVRRSRPAP